MLVVVVERPAVRLLVKVVQVGLAAEVLEARELVVPMVLQTAAAAAAAQGMDMCSLAEMVDPVS